MSNLPWKPLVGPLALIAVLGIGYAVYWHYAAQRLERTVDAWFEERRGVGWSAAHGAPAAGGFPMRLRLTLPEPAVAADPAGWRWRSRQAVLELQPWNWRQFRIVSTGPQDVEIRVDGVWRRVDAATERAVFIGRIRGDGSLWQGMLELTGLTLRDAANRRLVEAAAVRVRLRRPDVQDNVDGALSLVLRTPRRGGDAPGTRLAGPSGGGWRPGGVASDDGAGRVPVSRAGPYDRAAAYSFLGSVGAKEPA